MPIWLFGSLSTTNNAIKVLNLADKIGLSKTPITTDLFGGNWPQFKEEEMTHHKECLEAEKAKKASQKKGSGAEAGSYQSFWAPQSSNRSKPSGSQKQGGSIQKGDHEGSGGKGSSGGRKDGKDGGRSGTGSGASKGDSNKAGKSSEGEVDLPRDNRVAAREVVVAGTTTGSDYHHQVFPQWE